MDPQTERDALYEGRGDAIMDVDRMTNEGLAGGYVTNGENGQIGETTTDSMDDNESIAHSINRYHGMYDM